MLCSSERAVQHVYWFVCTVIVTAGICAISLGYTHTDTHTLRQTLEDVYCWRDALLTLSV